MLEINEDYGYMMVIVSGDAAEGNHMTNAVGSGVKLQQHYHDIRNYIKDYFGGIVGSVMSNKIAVLIPFNDPSMDYNDRVNVISKARELAHKLREKTDIAFRIGVGRVEKIKDMESSYRDAINSLLLTTNTAPT